MLDRPEPILPYPSRQSVIDSVLATIERSSEIDYPDGWNSNEPLYLKESDIIRFKVFNDAVDNAINGAEPAPWLLRDLKEFEQMIVEHVVEGLEDTSAGLLFLNGMHATAKRRSVV